MKGKALFSSKIFWTAVVGLLMSCYNLLFSKVIDEATQREILALEWADLIQAFLSAVTILFRYFTTKPISSILPLLLLLLCFSMPFTHY